MQNKTVKEVDVFELPRMLGVAQYVEYDDDELRRYSTATGLLKAQGCSKGVCVRYRVWVWTDNGARWIAKPRWRRRRDEEAGGCVRQQVADALWELAERGYNVEIDKECNIVVNNVPLGIISCKSADKCVEDILKYYEYASKEPPKPKRAPEEEEYEELLRRYPRLRWWNKSIIIDVIKKGGAAKWGMMNLLDKLANVDERVWAFLARFSLDLTCSIDVFMNRGEICVKFHINSCEPRIYCYNAGGGWVSTSENPKFLKLRPLEDGTVAEVYIIANKEYIRLV